MLFRNQTGKSSASGVEANYKEPASVTDLKGPWTVQFNAAQRGPEKPVVFETLQDWTTSSDNRIKYYSGTAIYNCKFNNIQSPGNKQVIIHLGQVSAMAKVTVNGTYAGGIWTAPYRLDITKLLKNGENKLQIEVVNTWMNRLIGDIKLPADQRPTWCPVNSYKPESPLQSSGLLGPVTIQTFQ